MIRLPVIQRWVDCMAFMQPIPLLVVLQYQAIHITKPYYRMAACDGKESN